MNGLEEENNTKPIEANCLYLGTIFSHFEEIMGTNNWQIISFACVHFLLSPWADGILRRPLKSQDPGIRPQDNPVFLTVGGPCDYDRASQP